MCPAGRVGGAGVGVGVGVGTGTGAVLTWVGRGVGVGVGAVVDAGATDATAAWVGAAARCRWWCRIAGVALELGVVVVGADDRFAASA